MSKQSGSASVTDEALLTALERGMTIEMDWEGTLDSFRVWLRKHIVTDGRPLGITHRDLPHRAGIHCKVKLGTWVSAESKPNT